jgi:hypothetical protein
MTATVTAAPTRPESVTLRPSAYDAGDAICWTVRRAMNPWFRIVLAVDPVPRNERRRWEVGCNCGLAVAYLFVTGIIMRALLGHGFLMVVATYGSTVAALKVVRVRLPRQTKREQSGEVPGAHPRAQEGGRHD